MLTGGDGRFRLAVRYPLANSFFRLCLGSIAALLCSLQLSGCGIAPRRGDTAESSARTAQRHPPLKGGGYYQDDGPGEQPPADLLTRPDPVPRIEPLASGANKPYSVFGRQYVPLPADAIVRQRGTASWYGRKFHGQRTSMGEPYDMYAMSAAHPTMPLPSYARVSNPANGRSVMLRVNDRGPFLHDRIIDLSYAAAYKLGLVGAGSGEVLVERLTPAQITQLQAVSPVATAQSPLLASVPAKTTPLAIPATVTSQPPITTVTATSTPSPSPSPTASRMTNEVALTDAGDTPATALPVDLTATPAPDAGTAWPSASPAASSTPTLSAPAVAYSNANADAAPLSTSGPQVYVQIGAFGTRGNAERLQSRVLQGLEGLAVPVRIVDDERLFKLQVGPLDAMQAQQLSAQLRQRFALTPMLIAR